MIDCARSVSRNLADYPAGGCCRRQPREIDDALRELKVAMQERSLTAPTVPQPPDPGTLPRLYLCKVAGRSPDLRYRVVSNPQSTLIEAYATPWLTSESEAWAQVGRDFRCGG